MHVFRLVEKIHFGVKYELNDRKLFLANKNSQEYHRSINLSFFCFNKMKEKRMSKQFHAVTQHLVFDFGHHARDTHQFFVSW